MRYEIINITIHNNAWHIYDTHLNTIVCTCYSKQLAKRFCDILNGIE
jgi:hypothetical protein